MKEANDRFPSGTLLLAVFIMYTTSKLSGGDIVKTAIVFGIIAILSVVRNLMDSIFEDEL